ncbi:fluoride efflux transporter CrcB [Streptomyces sp. NPDC047002]|uniref:fluoride efflux transporter CrcB n=1 Tax=Streptomyces sp. NPDC047002 TaxID=3155475 RepID=UPI003453487C
MRSEESRPVVVPEPIDPDVDMGDVRQRRELRRSHYGVLGVVAAGGVLGSVARYEAGLIWPTPEGTFPWTTFLINVIGCLVIGAFLVAVTEIFTAHPLLRPFFGTGVLGGFTTFSTYCVDIERLVDGGHAATALAYLAATLAAALAAVFAGAWTTRRLLADRSAS